MKKIRMVGMGLTAVALMSLNTGCFSYMATQSHNERAVSAQKAVKAHNAAAIAAQKNRVPGPIQATVLDGGEPGISLNLLDIMTPGYWSAWRANPGTMAAAAGGDILTTGALAAGTYYLTHSSSKSNSSSVTVNGNGNNVNYNDGGSTQTTSTDNSTKSGE